MSKNKDRICFLFPCVIFFETQQGRLRAQLSASSFQQTKVELSTTLCAQQRQGHYHADIGVIRASVFERSLPLLQLQFEVGSHLLVSSPKSSTPIAHEGETSTERVTAERPTSCAPLLLRWGHGEKLTMHIVRLSCDWCRQSSGIRFRAHLSEVGASNDWEAWCTCPSNMTSMHWPSLHKSRWMQSDEF